MTLEALGNLGDFLGGVGVIVTLGYLAVQIRQNTEQLRRNERFAQADAIDASVRLLNDFRGLIASDAGAADVWRRGSEDPESLEPSERVRFQMLAASLFRAVSANVPRVRLTDPDGPDAAIMLSVLGDSMRTPGVLEWWREHAHQFDPEFAHDVEAAWAAERGPAEPG